MRVKILYLLFIISLPLFFTKSVRATSEVTPHNISVEATDLNNNSYCEDMTVTFLVSNNEYSGWKVRGKLLDESNRVIYEQKNLCSLCTVGDQYCSSSKKCSQDYPELFYYGSDLGERPYTLYVQSSQIPKNLRNVIPKKIFINIDRELPAQSKSITHYEYTLNLPPHSCKGFEDQSQALPNKQDQILAQIKSLIDQHKYTEAEKAIGEAEYTYKKTEPNDYSVHYLYNWTTFPRFYLYKAIAAENIGKPYEAAFIYLRAGDVIDFVRLTIQLWGIKLFVLALEACGLYFLYQLLKVSKVIRLHALGLFIVSNLFTAGFFPPNCGDDSGLGCLGLLLFQIYFFALGLPLTILIISLLLDLGRFFRQPTHPSFTELIRRNARLLFFLVVNTVLIYIVDAIIWFSFSSLLEHPGNALLSLQSLKNIQLPIYLYFFYELIVNPISGLFLLGIIVYKTVTFLSARKIQSVQVNEPDVSLVTIPKPESNSVITRVIVFILWYIFGLLCAALPLWYLWNSCLDALTSLNAVIRYSVRYFILGFITGLIVYAFSERSFKSKKKQALLGLLLFLSIGVAPTLLMHRQLRQFNQQVISDYKNKITLQNCTENMYRLSAQDKENTLVIACIINFEKRGSYYYRVTVYDKNNHLVSDSDSNLSAYWDSRQNPQWDLTTGNHTLLIYLCNQCFSTLSSLIHPDGPYRIDISLSDLVEFPSGRYDRVEVQNFKPAYTTKQYAFSDFNKVNKLWRSEEQAKAIDVKKREDIDTVARLLEEYKAKNGRYPIRASRSAGEYNYKEIMRIELGFGYNDFPQDPEELVFYKYFSTEDGSKAVLYAELSEDVNGDGDFTNDLYLYFSECSQPILFFKKTLEIPITDFQTFKTTCANSPINSSGLIKPTPKQTACITGKTSTFIDNTNDTIGAEVIVYGDG